MSSPFQPQSRINSSDKKFNPAGDPTYKPVKQMFGYIYAIFVAIMTIVSILVSLAGIFGAAALSSFMVQNVFAQIRRDISENYMYDPIALQMNLDTISVIESFYAGDKIFWLSVIFFVSFSVDLYFYCMVLAYPEYCGGNPEFYKAWPLIVSSVLMSLGMGVFHPAFILMNVLPGLAGFAFRYFAYFGQESSSDGFLLLLLCFKPWVYKKIEDFEAPSYQYPTQGYPLYQNQGYPPYQHNPPQGYPPYQNNPPRVYSQNQHRYEK